MYEPFQFELNIDYSFSVTSSVCFYVDIFYGNFVAVAFFSFLFLFARGLKKTGWLRVMLHSSPAKAEY